MKKRNLFGMIFPALLVMAVMSSCSFIPLYETTETYNAVDMNAENIQRLILDNSVGDIEIRTGAEFSVTAVKRATSEKELSEVIVNHHEYNGTLTIETRYLKDSIFDFVNSGMINYQIVLPAGVSLGKIYTSTGDVMLNGDLSVSEISVDVGDITLVGSQNSSGTAVGRIIGSTGDIKVDGPYLLGPVSTSVGNISITGALKVDDLTSSTGDIFAEIRSFNGDIQIESSVGDVRLEVVRDFPCRILTGTSVGRIYNTAVVLDGSNLIDARTSTGDIWINNL